MIDKDLLYAATARCGRCGDGLAHPIDHVRTMAMRAWVCSRALKSGYVSGQHDRFDFALYKIREETSINNTGSHTTRPAGTVARTLGKATCPQCNHTWQSEPYNACGLGHHWFSGPCPNCGYAVGGAGTSSTRDGARIDHRFYDVVLDDLHGSSVEGLEIAMELPIPECLIPKYNLRVTGDPLDVMYNGISLRGLLAWNERNQLECKTNGFTHRLDPTQRAAVSAHWSAELRAKVAASKERDKHQVMMQIDADDL